MIQYNLMTRETFTTISDGIETAYAMLQDYPSEEEALNAAKDIYGEGGWTEKGQLLSISKINLKTGEIEQVYNRQQLIDYLDAWEIEEQKEASYGNFLESWVEVNSGVHFRGR